MKQHQGHLKSDKSMISYIEKGKAELREGKGPNKKVTLGTEGRYDGGVRRRKYRYTKGRYRSV